MRQYIAIAAIIALIGAFASGEWHGRKSERAKWEARINKERAEASEAARKQEQATQEQVNESLRRENERMARINAGLAADLDELRNRPPRRVPDATGTSCKGATGADLSGPDAGFLVGEAARADRLRAALATCYEYADSLTQ